MLTEKDVQWLWDWIILQRNNFWIERREDIPLRVYLPETCRYAVYHGHRIDDQLKRVAGLCPFKEIVFENCLFPRLEPVTMSELVTNDTIAVGDRVVDIDGNYGTALKVEGAVVKWRQDTGGLGFDGKLRKLKPLEDGYVPYPIGCQVQVDGFYGSQGKGRVIAVTNGRGGPLDYRDIEWDHGDRKVITRMVHWSSLRAVNNPPVAYVSKRDDMPRLLDRLLDILRGEGFISGESPSYGVIPYTKQVEAVELLTEYKRRLQNNTRGTDVEDVIKKARGGEAPTQRTAFA